MPIVQKSVALPVNEKAIGRRLRELRESRGLTQVELAAKLKTKQALVSAYELGNIRMHGALIAAFAQALDATSDEILCIESKRRSVKANDRRVARLLQDINVLSKRERDTLLKTIAHFVRGARTAA
ncbi:MAG: helix-turn-helix transcriptional regulator [Vicinamibacteria bacterium]|nr:helix-turn-helix transcriptional regulator [Vicinamibacteria bacterium]